MRAIAIDGPAGAGKSSVAQAVARRLGFTYIDTGAMYRAVAIKALRLGVDLEDGERMAAVGRGADMRFDCNGRVILLDGEDVSDAIRTPRVTAATRFAARAPGVRAELRRRQRELARAGDVIMEGRDICTVVLPEARWKFFLTASCEERARRRTLELRAAGHAVDEERILEQIRNRDLSDRQVGPMQKALELASTPGGGIELLDTTTMTPEQVVELVVARVRGS